MKATYSACTPIPEFTPIVRPKIIVTPTIPGMLPQVARLLEDTADHFGVEVDEVRSKLRTKNVAAARHVFWWVARKVWQYSYPEMGKLFGKAFPFDHTSVMWGVEKVEDHVRRGTSIGLAAKALRGGDEVQLTERGAISGPTSSSGSNDASGMVGK